jgi:hypothetical protein
MPTSSLRFGSIQAFEDSSRATTSFAIGAKSRVKKLYTVAEEL